MSEAPVYETLKGHATWGAFGFYPIREMGKVYMRLVVQWPRAANLIDVSDGWKVKETNRGGVTVVRKRDGKTLVLDRYHVSCMLNEVRAWSEVYLPAFSLEGKTVLDVGAGCGETAQFYFDHGAKRVVCVEADPGSCGYLRHNAEVNGWDVEVVNEIFSARHLDLLPHDFLKMDIEGGEHQLMRYHGALGPCRIEVHPDQMLYGVAEAIEKRFGLRQIQPGMKDTAIWGRDD